MNYVQICAAILLTVVDVASGQVQNPANGHYYVLTSTASDIYAARAEAASVGGHLVAINDQQEQLFIEANFGTEELWIGLSDENQEGAFAWDSGEAVAFTYWDCSEPNNSGGVENYVIANYLQCGTYRWNDVPANWGARGIIETDPQCWAGNVGLGLGGPFDVLTINGSAGLLARRVDVGIGSPITIAVAQPPTNPLPSSFALIGFIGVPTSADAYTLPFGIGTLCFPAPQLIPSYPGLFTLTNNFGPEPGQLVGSNPAPWSFTAAGLPFAFQFTLQGVIQQDPGTVRVMNGVIVNVQ